MSTCSHQTWTLNLYQEHSFLYQICYQLYKILVVFFCVCVYGQLLDRMQIIQIRVWISTFMDRDGRSTSGLQKFWNQTDLYVKRVQIQGRFLADFYFYFFGQIFGFFSLDILLFIVHKKCFYFYLALDNWSRHSLLLFFITAPLMCSSFVVFVHHCLSLLLSPLGSGLLKSEVTEWCRARKRNQKFTQNNS